MYSIKKLGVLATVIWALGAIGAANASAEFTYSATGELHGDALENQVYNTGSGEIICSGATTTGTIASTNTAALHLTVQYSGCKVFGLTNVEITKATFLFTTDGTVHLLQPVGFTVAKTLFTKHCTFTISEQTVGTTDYVNNGNNLILEPTITGIHSVGTGGPCGGTSSTGTFGSRSEIHRVGGGSVSFDG
jgi:hypothetical protein